MLKRTKLYELYDYYNWAYFGGELPEVDIQFMRLNGAFGYTIPDPFGGVDGILLADDMTEREEITTLVHEMIHVWQAVKEHKTWDHNGKFRRKAKKIAKGEGWKTKDII